MDISKKTNKTVSRVSNSIRNTLFGMGSYISILLATFISRKVFTNILGSEILGLNNYFTSIVTMLSLTELGIGTAMLSFLYEPVSLNNHQAIKSLMQFYKRIYNTIGILITLLGCFITIFIDKFVESTIPVNRIRIYFILFFLHTSITYFWSYKRNLLYATQRSDIISIVKTVCKIIVIIFQTVFLLKTRSYIIYLIFIILGNLADNIICSIIVDKQYPFINEKNYNPISKEHKKQLIKKVIPIFIYNLSDYSVTSLPSVIISTVNLITSGLYSNYTLITSTLRAILGSIFASFTYSFGNLAVLESDKKCYDVYLKIDFMTFWIVSTCTVIYINLIQPFIYFWLGSDYQLSFLSAILIGIHFYCIMMNVPAVSVHNALGLHQYDQYSSIGYAIVSAALSIILGKIFGLPGIMVALILSTLIFPTVTKPHVIYQKVFHVPTSKYYITYVKRFMLLIAMIGVTVFISNTVFSEVTIFNFVVRGLISFIIPTVILLTLYVKTNEFKYYVNLLKHYLKLG